jgi:hypothetical protein
VRNPSREEERGSSASQIIRLKRHRSKVKEIADMIQGHDDHHHASNGVQ